MVTGFTGNLDPVTSDVWDPWTITGGFQAETIDFYDPLQGNDLITLSVNDFAALYLPISIEGDQYFGQYVQVDEPPRLDANTDSGPVQDIENDQSGLMAELASRQNAILTSTSQRYGGENIEDTGTGSLSMRSLSL
jgi:hypothetical protein